MSYKLFATKPLLLKVVLALLVIAAWLWFSLPVFQLTFKDDDAHIMRAALSYPWYSFLYQPFTYQELSAAHYTPWIVWTYQFDFFLANGLNSISFFVHQWLSITILIILVAALAWKISGKHIALYLVLFLLILNPSVFQLLTENYTRHYIEGAIAICFSLLAALRWLETKKWYWWLISIVFFAISLLSKEIYIIVPFLYFWLPQLRTKPAIRLYVSWFIVALLYLGLRTYMLSGSVGGINGSNPMLLLELAWSGKSNVLAWLLQNQLALIITTAIALTVSENRIKTIAFFLVSLLFIVFPTLFAPHVWDAPEIHANRIFILLYLFFSIFSAVLLSKAISRRYQSDQTELLILSKPLIIISLFVWAYYAKTQTSSIIQTQKKTANHVITTELLKGSSNYDALAYSPAYQLGELIWVIEYFKENNINLLLTEQEVLSQFKKGKTIGRFNNTCGCIKPISNLPNRCKTELSDKHFQTTISYNSNLLSWSLKQTKENIIASESGIVFIDRNMVIPVASLSVNLVRPRHGETYRFYFIGKDGACWLGPIETILINKPSLQHKH